MNLCKTIVQTEPYSKLSRTSKMKCFAKTAYGFQPLTIFGNMPLKNMWQKVILGCKWGAFIIILQWNSFSPIDMDYCEKNMAWILQAFSGFAVNVRIHFWYDKEDNEGKLNVCKPFIWVSYV